MTSGYFRFIIISGFQTDLDGMSNFLLTKSTKKKSEEDTIELNQKPEITAIHFDQAFLFTMLYN